MRHPAAPAFAPPAALAALAAAILAQPPAASAWPPAHPSAAARTATLARPPPHLALALAAPPREATHPPATVSPPEPDPQHLVADEAWQLVDKYFASPSFDPTRWAAQRDTLAAARLPSPRATYVALRAAFRTLHDRYTRVLAPADMAALRRFDTSGVGLLLTTDAAGDLVVATDPPKDSSADMAGVLRGDVLDRVDGLSIKGQPAFSVSERMQGPDGSDIHLTFRKRGDVTLRRSFPPAIGANAIRATVVHAADGSTVGYIRLSEFRASSREEVSRACETLVRQGAQWLVLDLRKNGGGVFEAALEIAGIFEGEDVPVAQVFGRAGADAGASPEGGGKQEVYKSRLVAGDVQVGSDVDVAVLIDGGSASSSEVLAGALHDSCRAALVGERSYGKGVIQGVFGLSDGGGVVVTVAEYRTPNGDAIQGVGLKPDVSRRVGALEAVGRVMGIERVDESTVGVDREQVQRAVRMCTERSRAAS